MRSMTSLPLVSERSGTDSASRPDDTSRAAPCQDRAACVACWPDDADDARDARSRSPVTRGLPLRGIGPSGTSRALVLVDGVPANDPFGGWVYWGRIPMLGIEQIEVVRGGGSSAWGNYALGGVVQILTRRPTERALYFDASYGTRETMNFDLLLHDVEGPFRISLEGNYFSTGGDDVVKKARRGPVDIEYDSYQFALHG